MNMMKNMVCILKGMSTKTLSEELRFTGTQVNYYFVCRRKLWFFSHDLSMEEKSDAVLLGKLLHETRYKRKFKEVNLGRIKIDFLEHGTEVHEIKRSRRIEKAHAHQLRYYLYYLKKLGVDASGVLNYPLLGRKVDVSLTQEDETEMQQTLQNMEKILALEMPPPAVRLGICKKCSYYELCWC